MLYMYYAESPAYLTGESSDIHDCSVADMPQIKKWVGEVEAHCLIKIGKRKKSVGLKIKLWKWLYLFLSL